MTERGEKPTTRRELHSLGFGIALAMYAFLGAGCATSAGDGRTTRHGADTTTPASDAVLFKERLSVYQPPSENEVRVVLWHVGDIQGLPEYEKDPALLGQGPGGTRVYSDLPRTELVSKVTVNTLLRLGLPAFHRPRTKPDNPEDRPFDRLGATVRIRSFKISLSPVFEAQVTLDCAFFEPGSTAPFWSGPGQGQGRATVSFDVRASVVQDAIEGAIDRCVEQSRAQDINARVKITASSVSLKKGRATETSGNVQGALDLYAQAYREADNAYQTTEAVKALALLLRKKVIQPPFPEEARRFGVQASIVAKAQQYDKAIELYEKALDVAPWWAEGHFNRALILADQNLFPWAIAGMKRYLDLAPNAPDARAAQDKIYEWELKVK